MLQSLCECELGVASDSGMDRLKTQTKPAVLLTGLPEHVRGLC
jgi:hypothetical protein